MAKNVDEKRSLSSSEDRGASTASLVDVLASVEAKESSVLENESSDIFDAEDFLLSTGSPTENRHVAPEFADTSFEPPTVTKEWRSLKRPPVAAKQWRRDFIQQLLNVKRRCMRHIGFARQNKELRMAKARTKIEADLERFRKKKEVEIEAELEAFRTKLDKADREDYAAHVERMKVIKEIKERFLEEGQDVVNCMVDMLVDVHPRLRRSLIVPNVSSSQMDVRSLMDESSEQCVSSEMDETSQMDGKSQMARTAQMDVMFRMDGLPQMDGTSQMNGNPQMDETDQMDVMSQMDGNAQMDGTAQTDETAQMDGTAHMDGTAQMDGTPQMVGMAQKTKRERERE